MMFGVAVAEQVYQSIVIAGAGVDCQMGRFINDDQFRVFVNNVVCDKISIGIRYFRGCGDRLRNRWEAYRVICG